MSIKPDWQIVGVDNRAIFSPSVNCRIGAFWTAKDAALAVAAANAYPTLQGLIAARNAMLVALRDVRRTVDDETRATVDAAIKIAEQTL